MSEGKHYMYLVACEDESLYCGYTTDLKRRVAEHNEGIGCKYTLPRRPVSLVYWEVYSSRSLAMQREFAIKRLSRQQKLALISQQNLQTKGDTL